MQERKHFRIKFPQNDRPRVLVGGSAFDVIDCSESGLKIKASVGIHATVGVVIPLKIEFRSGKNHKSNARVVRQLQDLIMLQLEHTIPRDIMKAEAERLIAAYGEVETTRYIEQVTQVKKI